MKDPPCAGLPVRLTLSSLSIWKAWRGERERERERGREGKREEEREGGKGRGGWRKEGGRMKGERERALITVLSELHETQ